MSDENVNDESANDENVDDASTPGGDAVTLDKATDEPAADEKTTDEPAEDEPTTDETATRRMSATARRTTAAGAAASRARRIGGRLPSVPGSPATVGAGPADSSVDDDTAVLATDADLSSTADSSGDDPDATATMATRASATQGTPYRSQRQVLVSWAPAAILGIAALVFAVLVIIRAGDGSDSSSNATRDQVLAAAKTCLAATNTYKYTDLATYEKKGLACSTGEFQKEFKQTVEDVLKKNAPAVKQVQSLQVNAAGITDITDHNQWDLLIYGQTSVTNTSASNEIDPFGAVLRMQQVNGKWVIASLCSQTYNGSASRCY